MEHLAGVEERKCFGMDLLACCKDRVVEKLDLTGCECLSLGYNVLEAVERVLVSRSEQESVNRKTKLWWQ